MSILILVHLYLLFVCANSRADILTVYYPSIHHILQLCMQCGLKGRLLMKLNLAKSCNHLQPNVSILHWFSQQEGASIWKTKRTTSKAIYSYQGVRTSNIPIEPSAKPAAKCPERTWDADWNKEASRSHAQKHTMWTKLAKEMMARTMETKQSNITSSMLEMTVMYSK